MRVVIFDMDGTLVDSQHDITCSINYVRAEHYGLPPLPSSDVVHYINMPVRNLPELFYGTQTYEARDRALFEAHYHEQCIQNPRVYPGIEAMLEVLAEQEIRLAVATNAPSIFANRMIGHLGIGGYFEQIIGPDIAGASKPDPAMLHHILNAMGFDHRSHHAWMVGDNSKDIDAARAAGITGVFSTWGFSAEGEGDAVIDHPVQLLELL
ncbi:MAG TPA: HAD family hydrolase [Sulfuricurvum sp.]|nr:HAD family hydrolase [Sulfuricurvum sp.]